MINGVENAELSCIYKGPVVPLQHTIAVAIKLMSLFLRTAQPSCKRNIKCNRHSTILVAKYLNKMPSPYLICSSYNLQLSNVSVVTQVRKATRDILRIIQS